MNDHNRVPSQQQRTPSQPQHERKRVTRDLHSMVYVALVGLVLWLVLAVWGFGYDGQTDYLLTIVTGFLTIAVAIPAALALMVHSEGNSADPKDSTASDTVSLSFRQWAAEDFDTWQDRVKGRNAAVEVLLPMAAIAIGMTAFAIVFHFAALGA